MISVSAVQQNGYFLWQKELSFATRWPSWYSLCINKAKIFIASQSAHKDTNLFVHYQLVSFTLLPHFPAHSLTYRHQLSTLFSLFFVRADFIAIVHNWVAIVKQNKIQNVFDTNS